MHNEFFHVPKMLSFWEQSYFTRVFNVMNFPYAFTWKQACKCLITIKHWYCKICTELFHFSVLLTPFSSHSRQRKMNGYQGYAFRHYQWLRLCAPLKQWMWHEGCCWSAFFTAPPGQQNRPMATRRGAQINRHAQMKHWQDEHSSHLCFICTCVDLHPCSTIAVFHQLAQVLLGLWPLWMLC